MVRDVGRLFDDLGWDTVSLVGQSMGGINAFLFAAAKPARVDRLVVIDVGPEIAPEGAQRVRRTASGPAIFASIDDALAQARESFPRADPGLLERRVRHNLVAMPNRRWRWRTDASLLDGTATPDDHTVDERWDAWRAITCPTLLVHGVESDVLTSPLVDAMVDARVAPGLEVVEIAGAGHPVPLDQPDALAAAVGAFLDASAVL
jgi:pimeloyl-ACP methyl ester carboxylesterase